VPRTIFEGARWAEAAFHTFIAVGFQLSLTISAGALTRGTTGAVLGTTLALDRYSNINGPQ